MGTDALILQRLERVTPQGWQRLWAAAQLALTDPEPARWGGGDELGTTAVDGEQRPIIRMPYVEYADSVNAFVALLYELDLVVDFDWSSWDGFVRYRGGDGLGKAPASDAVRLLTTVVRAERFSDGVIERSIEDGTIEAAIARLRHEYTKD
jgi:hypothetical protein